MRGMNIGASPPWPGPTTTTRGRPRPSTIAWIFVPAPALERPTPWSGGSTNRFLQVRQPPCVARCVGRVLVGAHTGRVHTHVPVEVAAGIGPCHQGLVDGVQRAVPPKQSLDLTLQIQLS